MTGDTILLTYWIYSIPTSGCSLFQNWLRISFHNKPALNSSSFCCNNNTNNTAISISYQHEQRIFSQTNLIKWSTNKYVEDFSIKHNFLYFDERLNALAALQLLSPFDCYKQRLLLWKSTIYLLWIVIVFFQIECYHAMVKYCV